MSATKKAAAKKSAPKSSKAAKPETAAKSQPETAKPETSNAVARTRVTILGHSATSVLKWMGQNGIDLEGARKAVAKLASGEVKPSTITTGLSDAVERTIRRMKAENEPVATIARTVKVSRQTVYQVLTSGD